MNYLDFELEIGTGSGREYPIAVVRSPAGEARETMHYLEKGEVPPKQEKQGPWASPLSGEAPAEEGK